MEELDNIVLLVFILAIGSYFLVIIWNIISINSINSKVGMLINSAFLLFISLVRILLKIYMRKNCILMIVLAILWILNVWVNAVGVEIPKEKKKETEKKV